MRPLANDRPSQSDFAAAQQALFDESGLDPRSRVLELPDVGRVHVFEAGSDRGKVPRIFVHGTAGFGAFLAPLMAAFDEWTIAFDRPGYGLSDEFEYTISNIRRTVVGVSEGVMNGVGVETANLVGHSMGGHASLRFARQHPDRVRQLATVGAVPGMAGTTPPFPLRVMSIPLLGGIVSRLQSSGGAGVLEIAEVFGERENIKDYPALIRALAVHEADSTAAAAGKSEFKALFSIRGWHPSIIIDADELRGVQRPTTVIWGDNDPLGHPNDVQGTVDSIPNVQFHSLKAGHIPYLADPNRCAELVQGM